MDTNSHVAHFHNYRVRLIGTLREAEVEAVIDTGAQISLIGRQLAEQIGAQRDVESASLEVCFADGRRVFSERVRIEVLAEDRRITLLPVVFDSPSSPLLLGLDFLRQVDYLPLYLREFVSLFRHIKRLRDNCVLVIGSYTSNEGSRMLERIKAELARRGYEPILLRDYPDIEEQTNEEKMNLFGHLSKFVICENSYPSGHIDELNICTRNRLVTVVLQQEGMGATWMQACYPIDFSFVKMLTYRPDSIDTKIGEAIRVAEELVAERTRQLNQLYIHRRDWIEGISGRE